MKLLFYRAGFTISFIAIRILLQCSITLLCVVRFEKLDLECLHLNERYLEALLMFQDEIEELRDRYNEERQNPLLPRNMPPISGRIMWIRQLYSRIEEPMNIFKTKTKVRHQSGNKTLLYKRFVSGDEPQKSSKVYSAI